ncbi:MAG: hypothetical protein IKF64_08775, partial [Eubacterium sp.]|nr:hypothetical protein [Eubacterium sp.]
MYGNFKPEPSYNLRLSDFMHKKAMRAHTTVYDRNLSYTKNTDTDKETDKDTDTDTETDTDTDTVRDTEIEKEREAETELTAAAFSDTSDIMK